MASHGGPPWCARSPATTAALPQLPSCTAASTHATPPAEIPARDTSRLHVRVVQVALPAVLDRDIARLRDEVDPYTLTLTLTLTLNQTPTLTWPPLTLTLPLTRASSL